MCWLPAAFLYALSPTSLQYSIISFSSHPAMSWPFGHAAAALPPLDPLAPVRVSGLSMYVYTCIGCGSSSSSSSPSSEPQDCLHSNLVCVNLQGLMMHDMHAAMLV
jgi:hypothetical protein